MVTFLVDGYNLMHAAGLASSHMRPGRLDPARKRFLDWVADADPVRAGSARVRVVFDAQNGTGNDRERPHRGGVWVRFAYKQTADDLIETMLASESAPAQLTVVSNDGRIREAARRRGAGRWGCEAFMDWLISGAPGPDARAPQVPRGPEKPDGPASPVERDELLLAFLAPKPR